MAGISMAVMTALPEIRSSAQATSARPYLRYILFALCFSLYLLPFMRLLLLGTDEGTLVHGAVRIVHGQVFARDFFEVIGPGTFYGLAAFFKLFGATFLTSRIYLFFTSLGTALLLYYLSRRVCEKYQLLPSVLFFAVSFGMLWPAISHHTDSNFVAILAFTCLVLWQDTRRSILLLIAGALAGAATCILQPKGMLLFCAFLACLWFENKRNTIPRRAPRSSHCGLSLRRGTHAYVFPESEYAGQSDLRERPMAIAPLWRGECRLLCAGDSPQLLQPLGLITGRRLPLDTSNGLGSDHSVSVCGGASCSGADCGCSFKDSRRQT
jgi:hypothetical protein